MTTSGPTCVMEPRGWRCPPRAIGTAGPVFREGSAGSVTPRSTPHFRRWRKEQRTAAVSLCPAFLDDRMHLLEDMTVSKAGVSSWSSCSFRSI